jgi:hypothetical protein
MLQASQFIEEAPGLMNTYNDTPVLNIPVDVSLKNSPIVVVVGFLCEFMVL